MAWSATRLDDAMAHGAQRAEVQTVSLTGSPTGGTFTLTFGGQTTGGIAFDATAGTIDTALEALSTIAASEIVCAGGPINTTPVTVTWIVASGNVGAITGSGASLTGGTSPEVAIAQTTGGYGAEKATLNAAIDTLGAALDTFCTGVSASTAEAEKLRELLYEFGSRCASTITDQTS